MGGVDLFILETFSDLSEIEQAILAVKEIADVPVIAEMTVNENGNSLYGTAPETFTYHLDRWGADVVGINCSVGPPPMMDALEKIVHVTKKPIIIQPNAGSPRVVEERNIYLAGLGLLTLPLDETRAQTADSLSVVVNRPPDGSEILGLKQSFPHPNLAIISVTNPNGTPVVGLANSERWLDAHEVAENGRLISEIWQPLVEYQQNNPTLPADPDLYNQRPGPKFLEVCEDCGPVVPISVTLLKVIISKAGTHIHQ